MKTPSPRDEADLMWFFSEGTCQLGRSTMGGMLEWAKRLSWSSEGTRIPRPDRGSLQVIPIASRTSEPSYELDDTTLVRLARVSRMLRTMPEELSGVLSVYYGDLGARWARTKQGRIFALYAFTKAGRRFCEEDTRAHPAELRADERIARLVKASRGAAGGLCKRRLDRIHEEAVTLLGRAFAAWGEVRCAA